MATLPTTPVNTAITVGALAAMGLVAYTQTLRTKIESQIHENYRHFKLVDAGIDPADANPLKLAKRSDKTA